MAPSSLAGMLCKRTVRIARYFRFCDAGATAIEYGLIASLLGMAIISSAGMTGNTVSTTFEKLSNLLSEASSDAPPSAAASPPMTN